MSQKQNKNVELCIRITPKTRNFVVKMTNYAVW